MTQGKACAELELGLFIESEQSIRKSLLICENQKELMIENNGNRIENTHSQSEIDNLEASCLYLLGQSYIGQNKFMDAKRVLDTALMLVSAQNNHSKQIAVYDLLNIVKQNLNQSDV